MRISRAQAQANRERIVQSASELFRSQGFEAVSVADVMSAAGLTHGGFYNHFSSKEELAADALKEAWSGITDHRAKATTLKDLVRAYLSKIARSRPGKACPAAALAGDIRRQPEEVRHVFAVGLEEMIASLVARMDGDRRTRRRRAVVLATRMIGALMLSRAVPDSDPLAEELLSANLSASLAELGE